MISVTLYSRKDCHLCDEAHQQLDELQSRVPHDLLVVDIDRNPDLRRAYGTEIPVVEVGPYHLKAPFTAEELEVTLRAAQYRLEQIESVDASLARREAAEPISWTRADRFSYWWSKHYMLVFNLFVLIYVGLPFLAPVLMRAGAEAPARLIYRGYSLACHQLAYRSFFLFGEQVAYPREAAGVGGLATFAQASGISEASSSDDLLAARSFVGNEAMGYKVALCERDVSIYGGILLFGVLFALTGFRIPKLPWYLWVLLGIVPIAVDGFSQLFSQPPFSLWEYRESTPFLRSLTGFLFGVTTAWFGYPIVEESMAATRRLMATRLQRVQKALTRPSPGPHPASPRGERS